MYIDVNGHKIFVATGGKPFDKSLPCVVLLHGSGLDHRCWALQARWFAFHGFCVFCPDLPGHSLSAGSALTSIEAMGQWVVDALTSAEVKEAHLVGHSQGFLVALEAATILKERVRSITALATASAIPVNGALIDTAQQSPAKAAAMMLQWGFGSRYQFGMSAVPGMQPIGIGQRIMAQNPLAEDLIACNHYSQGEQRALALTCPRHVVLASEDRMTPLREGKKLADAMQSQAVVVAGVGHMLPIEAPEDSLNAMRNFIQPVQ